MFYGSNLLNIPTPLFFILCSTDKGVQMGVFIRQNRFTTVCSYFDAVDAKKQLYVDKFICFYRNWSIIIVIIRIKNPITFS